MEMEQIVKDVVEGIQVLKKYAGVGIERGWTDYKDNRENGMMEKVAGWLGCLGAQLSTRQVQAAYVMIVWLCCALSCGVCTPFRTSRDM